jgi:hypothetical protein
MGQASPDWDLILHHLEAASCYAEDLAELQRKIEAVRDEAIRAAGQAPGTGRRPDGSDQTPTRYS